MTLGFKAGHFSCRHLLGQPPAELADCSSIPFERSIRTFRGSLCGLY